MIDDGNAAAKMYTIKESEDGCPLSWILYNGEMLGNEVYKFDWVSDLFIALSMSEMDRVLISGSAPVSVCWWDGETPMSCVANWRVHVRDCMRLCDVVDGIYDAYYLSDRVPEGQMVLEAIHVDVDARCVYVDFRLSQ